MENRIDKFTYKDGDLKEVPAGDAPDGSKPAPTHGTGVPDKNEPPPPDGD